MSEYRAINGYLGDFETLWTNLAYAPFAVVDPVFGVRGVVVPKYRDDYIGIEWSEVPVILDSNRKVEWQSSGAGGVVDFYMDGSYSGDIPAPIIVVGSLQHLVKRGKEAVWSITMQLEPYVRELVAAASRRVGADVGSMTYGVLDETTIDQVTDELVTGGLVLRLVERTATTSKLGSQSLGSYLHINLRSMAETAVRRYIGDPHVGRKIRAVLAETQANSMDELLDNYRRRFPREKVSKKRAANALTAGSLLEVGAVSVDLLSEGERL